MRLRVMKFACQIGYIFKIRNENTLISATAERFITSSGSGTRSSNYDVVRHGVAPC